MPKTRNQYKTRHSSGFCLFIIFWYRIGTCNIMNRTLSSEDLSLLRKGLAAAGVRLSPVAAPEHSREISCCFIHNPDGTLRWLWPKSDHRASFLKFYHTGSFRSRTMALLLRMALRLGLGSLAAGGTASLYLDEESYDKLQQLKAWSLFTGTIGATRKLVAWFSTDSGDYFAKMPLTELAASNLHNEFTALKEPAVPGMVKPAYCRSQGNLLVQSDLYHGKKWNVPSSVGELPQDALQQWLTHDLRHEPLQTTNWWKSAGKKRDYLRRSAGDRIPALILERLNRLMSSFRPDMQVPVAPAHGDFTPWNVRCNRVSLAAVDWELYDGNRPALYDLFHFVYQDTILVRRGNYADVRKILDELFSQPAWLSLFDEQEVDPVVAEQLYLVHTVSYYLDLYVRQEKWHDQIDWLLGVWCEALGFSLQKKFQLSSRGILLQDIVHFLRHTRYAALKLEVEDISALPVTSDLDLCIDRDDTGRLVQWLAAHGQVVSCTEKRFSFMRRVTLILQDDSFLHIDCLWAIRRKHTTFMDIGEIIARADRLSSGVKVAATMHEVEYTWLFHLLNNSSVPDRQRERFLDSIAHHLAIDRLIWRYGLNTRPEQLCTYDPSIRGKMSLQIRKRYAANRGLAYWRNRLAYLCDVIRQLRPSRGYLITFSGVDGAGKSTVIRHIAGSIDKELRMPVVVLRHRPSLLPILSAWKYGKTAAEEKSVQSLPRKGSEQAGIRSLLRFSYYYCDYLLGQLYIHMRYVYRGYAVLYDRYYFDFISDSRRSNLVVPSWLSYGLYRFLLKPDFNYFLFAPTETILKRKQELDEHTINTLNRKYLQLFTRLRSQDGNHTYDAVCNIELKATLHTILNNIKNDKLCAVL